MTSKRQLNAAIIEYGTRRYGRRWYPSAERVASVIAQMTGAQHLGGALVCTDECVCVVRVNRAHNVAWAEEASC